MLIARQPILNNKNEVFGYELLYREVGHESYACDDDNIATINVILNNFLSFDVKNLFEKKKIFINFTESLINQDIATLFSKEELIIEINAMDSVDSKMIESCRRLKSFDYKLAFGEFVLKEGFEDLLELADIIKVDFLNVSDEEKISLVQNNKNLNVDFLAEKVETQNEYTDALRYGYTLFQGYFFAKPSLISPHNLTPSKINVLQLIKAVSEKDIEFEDLTWIIESDVAFSYEILKIVNSAFFSRGRKISSVRQALVRLGMTEVKKWAMISSLRRLGGNENKEIITIAMIRSRFLEMFSKIIHCNQKGAEFMTVGILSMLEVLTQVKLEVVLDTLSLAEEVKDALINANSETSLAIAYQIIVNIEQGQWKMISELATKLNVSIKDIADVHFEAIKYVIDTNKKLNEGLEGGR